MEVPFRKIIALQCSMAMHYLALVICHDAVLSTPVLFNPVFSVCNYNCCCS